MQSDTNQNYPPAVGQKARYVAPPLSVPPPLNVGATQPFTGNPANPTTRKNGPKMGLVVGAAAVAGFLGGILWSKVKKNREAEGTEVLDNRRTIAYREEK